MTFTEEQLKHWKAFGRYSSEPIVPDAAIWEMSGDPMKGPVDFFPVGFDRTGLIDMTVIGDEFKKYMAPEGGIVNCKDFYDAYREWQKDYEARMGTMTKDGKPHWMGVPPIHSLPIPRKPGNIT